MPTYNQEDYIKEAVESVMSQVLDAPFVLLLQDDASEDGTAIVARELTRIYKGRINLILNKENQFLKQPGSLGLMLEKVSRIERRHNIVNRILNTGIQRHAYVALCEGDDYWTNVNKLQIQLDNMRSDNELSLIHHAVEVQVEPGGSKEYAEGMTAHLMDFNGKDISEYGSFFRYSHNVMTCSAFFRLAALDLDLFLRRPIESLGDWILFALLTTNTEPKYLSEKMATYRVRPGSVWSSKSKAQRDIVVYNSTQYIEAMFNKGKK